MRYLMPMIIIMSYLGGIEIAEQEKLITTAWGWRGYGLFFGIWCSAAGIMASRDES